MPFRILSINQVIFSIFSNSVHLESEAACLLLLTDLTASALLATILFATTKATRDRPAAVPKSTLFWEDMFARMGGSLGAWAVNGSVELLEAVEFPESEGLCGFIQSVLFQRIETWNVIDLLNKNNTQSHIRNVTE